MLNISRKHKRTISLQPVAPPPPPPPPAPAPYRVLRVPDVGRFVQLVDDWDTAKWGYMPRSRALNYKIDPPWNGLPATVQTQKIFYALNREWQFFYLDCIRRATFDTLSEADLLNDYRNLVRDSGGWRDQHTGDNWRDRRDNVPPDQQKVYTDYVLGLNLPPAHTYGDAAQQDLLSSGNIIRVLREDARWIYFETLDPLKPPPPVNEVWGKWWKVGWATVSGYNWTTGEKRRMKWSRFGGYGCPLMFLGRGGENKVEKFWTRPIANGAEFSLYT